MQEVTWTALPNGVTGTGSGRRLRLSVFVSPRLTSEQPDARLPQDFADWPGCVQPGKISFTVQVQGAQPVAAGIVSPPPQPDLWKALFGPATAVHPPDDGPAVRGKPVYSTFPLSAVRDQVRRGHGQLAADNSALDLDRSRLRAAYQDVLAALEPADEAAGRRRHGAGLDHAGDLRQLHAEAALDVLRPAPDSDLSQRVAEATALAGGLAADAPGPVPVIAAGDGPAHAFASLVAFHHGPASSVRVAADSSPVIDFHKALTFLSEYPQLMRWLGLVIDVEVAAEALPQSTSGRPSPLLKVVPVFTPARGLVPHTPWTAYRWDGQFFEAATAPATGPSASSELVHGLLDLSHGGLFEVVGLDVDGAVFKILNALSSEVLRPAPATTSASDPVEVPALRSSGVTLARAGRAETLLNHMLATGANRDALARGADIVLFAEDLVRGYRIDVRDMRSGTWHSLHRRVGTYGFPAHAGGPVEKTIEDEGVVQPVVTRAALPDGSGPDPASPFHIHESLALWQNWSLAAPRPGRTITPDGAQRVTSRPQDGGPPVAVTFQAAAHSLPRLCFGASYQFRARTADLAGNGPSLSDADALVQYLGTTHQDPLLPGGDTWFTYRRLEPVSPPVLVPCERFGDGESESVLVIRSRSGQPAPQYAAELTRELAAAHPGDGAHYRGTCERHLVPPKVSLETAEAHGALDAGLAAPGGVRTTYTLARREKGSLNDTFVLDLGTGEPVPVPPSSDTNPVTGATVSRPSVETVLTGTTEAGPGGYAVHHEPQLQVPYLADPSAHGVALRGLPGLPTGGNEAGTLDAQGRLTFAPSPFTPDTLARLGGSTVHIGFTEAWPQRLPFRLRLADAATALPGSDAPPPSWDPQNRILTVYLAPAQQAGLSLSSSFSTRNDRTELQKFELWQWIVQNHHDHGREPSQEAVTVALQGCHRMITPFRTVTLVHAVEAPLAAPDLSGWRVLRSRGETFAYLGGAVHVHGASTAKIDLLATWTEYSDDGDPAAGPPQLTRQIFEVPIPLPGENAPTPSSAPGETVPLASYAPAPADTLTLQAPATVDPPPTQTYLSRHEFGDTRHRKVTYQALATSRFRECFPPAISDDPERISVRGNTVTRDVPSSERPAAPTVESVLPAFRWTRWTDPDGTRHSVRQGGIRVYLDRPWYSSGEGELLGVITSDPAHDPPPTLTPGFVTHWGLNPTFGAPGPTSTPRPSSFPGTLKGSNLSVGELESGQTVGVAGHNVAFDPVRQLWFCDIDTSTALGETYFPYVRLALARYQPCSVPGTELSRVVQTDYVGTAPRRTVTLTPVRGTPRAFDLLVEGACCVNTEWKGIPEVFYPDKLPETSRPRPLVDVYLDQQMPGTTDDLGWTALSSPEPDVAVTMGTQPAPAASGPLWHGRVNLPPESASQRIRIRIEENEFYTAATVTELVRDPFDGENESVDFKERAGRTVFAETIEL
ncbi:hypothetical protein [Streptomyces lydicus]|uniref:hypothetical protein n=1 Tax=Streptomyces lydicus TaxID=47763 RepID=UPI000981A9FC|nr:hypothetical protein [Streptomyces lydicus]